MLHDAIAEILKSTGRAMSPTEIADQLNRRGLYSRRGGLALPGNQISARVRRHPSLFVRTPSGIWLRNLPVPPFPTASVQQPISDAGAIPQPIGNLQAVEARLLAPEAFRSAADVDDEVPALFGLYAIRIRDASFLPSLYREAAVARGTDLLYLGEATRRTLRHRFLGNELRGRGHGTFFRSIGAVLGYTPPAGSLIGKVNTRNYKFSPADTDSIVDWIGRHLEVSWVALDAGTIHQMEVALIRTHRPLLNLRDNPAALAELSELRRLCSLIALGPGVPMDDDQLAGVVEGKTVSMISERRGSLDI